MFIYTIFASIRYDTPSINKHIMLNLIFVFCVKVDNVLHLVLYMGCTFSLCCFHSLSFSLKLAWCPHCWERANSLDLKTHYLMMSSIVVWLSRQVL